MLPLGAYRVALSCVVAIGCISPPIFEELNRFGNGGFGVPDLMRKRHLRWKWVENGQGWKMGKLSVLMGRRATRAQANPMLPRG